MLIVLVLLDDRFALVPHNVSTASTMIDDSHHTIASHDDSGNISHADPKVSNNSIEKLEGLFEKIVTGKGH